MDGKLLIIGTIGMLALALGLIVFFLLYRKKIYEKQMRLIALEKEHQVKLTNAFIEAKEKEQKRVAQDLHDEVSSALTAVNLSLHKYKLSSEDKQELGNNIKTILTKVREISNDLHPSVLEELGLIKAIQNLSRKFDEQSKIKFQFENKTGGDFNLTKEVELAIYRVTQELLTNILKYAGASQVMVKCIQNVDQFLLTIEDDGKGFTGIADNARPTSLGLKNIESRIQQIGAKLEYEKDKKKGSKVILTYPS